MTVQVRRHRQDGIAGAVLAVDGHAFVVIVERAHRYFQGNICFHRCIQPGVQTRSACPDDASVENEVPHPQSC